MRKGIVVGLLVLGLALYGGQEMGALDSPISPLPTPTDSVTPVPQTVSPVIVVTWTPRPRFIPTITPIRLVHLPFVAGSDHGVFLPVVNNAD